MTPRSLEGLKDAGRWAAAPLRGLGGRVRGHGQGSLPVGCSQHGSSFRPASPPILGERCCFPAGGSRTHALQPCGGGRSQQAACMVTQPALGVLEAAAQAANHYCWLGRLRAVQQG